MNNKMKEFRKKAKKEEEPKVRVFNHVLDSKAQESYILSLLPRQKQKATCDAGPANKKKKARVSD